MQRSVRRRRRQLLVFRLCWSNKFCISTKQCTLQMMQCLRVFFLFPAKSQRLVRILFFLEAV